jgi:hypothetical protein
VNPVTGSVLVTFSCDIETLAKYARTNELFSLYQSRSPNKSLFQDMAAMFHSYDEAMKKMTGGELDIPSLVFLSLLVSGIWQVARGNVAMPAWYTAFYYALSVFASSKTEMGDFDEGESLIGVIDDAAGE